MTNADTGKQANYLLMSSGQKALVLHALRWAITLYAKERSDRDFRSVYCDEVDGKLDPETRHEFVTMNRDVMKIGGFDAMFLVSHSDEVVSGADHLIRFGDGRISIN